VGGGWWWGDVSEAMPGEGGLLLLFFETGRQEVRIVTNEMDASCKSGLQDGWDGRWVDDGWAGWMDDQTDDG